MPEKPGPYTVSCATWTHIGAVAGTLILAWFAFWEIREERCPSALMACLLLIDLLYMREQPVEILALANGFWK